MASINTLGVGRGDLDVTDFFCGAGGSSTGLVNAGFTVRLAANHWKTAIETHALNHSDADHLCADINNYDMRRLPFTRVLWASPICTENSPGGGNAGKRNGRRSDGQMAIEEFGHVEQAGFERTRATFHDVIRATEVRRYDAVLVENVADVVWRWELFDWWCDGMIRLGYQMQVVCASSAHLGGQGNVPAPQWRDRLYLCFTRTGIPLPDVAVTPRAWCPRCEADVDAVQHWSRTAKRIFGHPVGKYRQSYRYVCPRGHAEVEPYVQPAAGIINWDDLGVPIGERAAHGLRPLAASTMAKVVSGLEMLGEAALITVNHSGHDGRPKPAAASPFPTQTVRIGDGIATHPDLAPAPFIATLRNNVKPHLTDKPVWTLTGGGNHHALVIPYRSGNRVKTTSEPLLTLHTRDSAGIASPAFDVDSCRFRMLQPSEQFLTQRFPRDYRVTGNVGEQTMQAGNAVSCNAAQWLGERVKKVLA